jgi:hypothetical protein
MALDRARRVGAFTTHAEFSLGTPHPKPSERASLVSPPQAGEGSALPVPLQLNPISSRYRMSAHEIWFQ